MPSRFAGDRYEVRRPLGEGSRKKVYLAYDTRLDRDVAFALIKKEGLTPSDVERMRREAQAMGRLGGHPNIVTVFDVGEDRGHTYITSEYMQGGSVENLLTSAAPLDLDVVLRIGQDVCRALEHAHERRIIHRDLKPSNIWLTSDGTAKLGDFGLAVALDQSRLSVEGTMVGTVYYIAPEQALGKQHDHQCDLYSLGAVLYEMLTGRPPFVGDDSVSIISQHLNSAAVAPSWHNPAVPPALERLVMRLLEKVPEKRPASAAEVRGALATIDELKSGPSAPAPPADIQLQATSGAFVGRDEQLSELRTAVDEAVGGYGRLALISGEPGIGKTRVAEEVMGYAQLRGSQALIGRCYEEEGAPPFWPWIQILRSYVHDRGPATLLSEMGSGAADIAQLVSDVRERIPGLPPPPSLDPEASRFRLFDSIRSFLKNASRSQPLILLLDDLHWADESSLLLLQFMARDLADARLLVIGTYRDESMERTHALSRTLGDIAREHVARHVALPGLTERDTARFIEMTSGITPSDRLVKRVHKETEGNPFFVTEIVRLLMSEGRLDQPDKADLWSVDIPQGVREVIGRRLDHLSPGCSELLRSAAVIGRDFSTAVLERVTERPGDELLPLLDEGVEARIIEPSRESPGRYSFIHTLVRETLLDELPKTQQIRLHRRIGRVLEEVYAGHLEPHLPELAYHFFEAAPSGDLDKAIHYCIAAGRRAAEQHAHESAVEHYTRALQAMDLQVPADDRARCELLIELGEAQIRSGGEEPSRETFMRAVELAKELNAPELQGAAALAYSGRNEWGDKMVVDTTIVSLLEDALAAIGDEPTSMRARLLGRLAVALYWSDEHERKETLAQESIEVARRVGDTATIAYALRSKHSALWSPDNVEDRLITAGEIVRLAEEAGDDELTLLGRLWHATDLWEMADITSVDAEADVYSRMAESLREPRFIWLSLVWKAGRAMLEGRLDEAERLAEDGYRIGEKVAAPAALQMYGAELFILRWHQGRLDELEQGFADYAEQSPELSAIRCGLAWLYAQLDRRPEAAREFEIVAQDDFARMPKNVVWLTNLANLAVTCSYLGDRTRAQTLYDLLLPYADRQIITGGWTPIWSYGAASSYLGLLATTLERFDDAERHFDQAIELNTRIRAKPLIAQTHFERAHMLVARDSPGDRARALRLLVDVLDIAQATGFKSLTDKALALKLQIQGVTGSESSGSIERLAATLPDVGPELIPHMGADGTVTILFTDISEFTQMTERLGDEAMHEIVEIHNRVIRREVETHRGIEVQTLGDGFMLAFPDPSDAVRCAIKMQREIAQAPLPEAIRIRVGIHTGEAVLHTSGYFGRTVILAARVADQATGGEILVSPETASRVRGSLSAKLGSARTVNLKGLAGEHRVIPVDWRPSGAEVEPSDERETSLPPA